MLQTPFKMLQPLRAHSAVHHAMVTAERHAHHGRDTESERIIKKKTRNDKKCKYFWRKKGKKIEFLEFHLTFTPLCSSHPPRAASGHRQPRGYTTEDQENDQNPHSNAKESRIYSQLLEEKNATDVIRWISVWTVDWLLDWSNTFQLVSIKLIFIHQKFPSCSILSRTWGGLMTAEKFLMSNMPKLETVKVPPWNSCGFSLPFLAASARRTTSALISTRPCHANFDKSLDTRLRCYKYWTALSTPFKFW